jgi:peptidoglycan-N-acetylglucosamine deacetylase
MPDRPSPWPDSCQGGVSLTFDDGMQSQLDTAAPLLNEHHLSGTFYLNPRGGDVSEGNTPSWRDLLTPWREVSVAGHELGNHTVTHPCSWAFKKERGAGLEAMTLPDIEFEIREGQRRIAAVIPEQARNSFCYPCYHSHVGEGPSRQSYVPIVSRYHSAARAKGDYANFPGTVDLHHLSSCPVERYSCQQMIGFIEQAITGGQWAILTFHGIHQGHLSVSDVDFRGICAYLDDNRNRIHVDTVVSVAELIAEWRTTCNDR